MTEEEFRSHISEAAALLRLSHRIAYYQGYIKGLSRFYRGPSVETIEEHENWLTLSYNFDETTGDLGRGYRDGLMGVRPKVT
jgi:hypothetical protein